MFVTQILLLLTIKMAAVGSWCRVNVFNFGRILSEIRNISFESSSSEVKVPPRPKRPLSPYMLFIKDKKKEMFGDYSKVSATNQVKILSEKWRSLSEVEKQIYSEKFKENLNEYTKVNEAYMKSLTEEQRQIVQNQFRLRKEQLRQKRWKSTLRKLNKPIRPRSPYNFFIAERLTLTFGTPVSEKIRKIAADWKDLPEEKKKIYKKKAEDDKIRFATEMEKWKSKMLSEGHEDILDKLKK